MNTNSKAAKLYPVNTEKAESTLQWAMTGLHQKEDCDWTAEDYAAEKAIHDAEVELRTSKITIGKFGNYVSWVSGKLYGFIKGAGMHNDARWAAMNAR